MRIRIIGAGLAGCEACYYLAKKGYEIDLYEMRPNKMTPAHKTKNFAELVCSNSLRADSLENACGILKKEMEVFDSIVIKSARLNSVEAGGALAVDRISFSTYIENEIRKFKNVHVINEEINEIDDEIPTIIATGPLTSDALSLNIISKFGYKEFHFYDAAAPIVMADSIDYNKVYLKSRYDKGVASYYNCPMTKEEFDIFYDALISAEGVVPHDFEKEDNKNINNQNDEVKVFEGCMPVEIMAKRGRETLLFGPLKPVGLEKADGTLPYAVVQLRVDDAKKTMYNLVGFQTHLKWPEQKRVFSLIPGLENANFVKYGVMHRNSFINAPAILNKGMQTKKFKNIFFAGQLSGVEGYVESAASGIVAAINMDRYLSEKDLYYFSSKTIMGSMINYICNASPDGFQPMNANFGIVDELGFKHKKQDRKMLYATRALEEINKAKEWLDEN